MGDYDEDELDQHLTEHEIDAEFERTQSIGNAINALYRAEQIMADAVAAERRDRMIAEVLDQISEESTMSQPIPPVPEWASDTLRRLWPTLTDDDRAALIGDHDNAVLRETAAQLRHTDSADSLGAQPAGMFTIDSNPHLKWHAERFEEPWNGWVTPVVTRETLENLFADLADGDYSPGAVQEDGCVLVYMPDYDDGDYYIEPDADGLYHLVELGWTFDKCD
ncbi:MAG: hypothetical protein WBA05_02430 [Gordonia sp. (in: high G+C Gram-positive bacteria)]|uniref:hypothetical protein n=1 Tax=Gordonia sp. (in: high G+C Gram-positive bacteria) TaxID=84139 RepID=UPI003C7300AE